MIEKRNQKYKMKSGVIFDIKRYAIHDGPGIRTTVFFKGCQLRCLWCHNPEGLALEPELTFKENRCIQGCLECVRNCPRSAISAANHSISINKQECDLCGDCAEVCPTQALEIIGREVSVTEVMKEIEKDMIFYDESAGGVTFSGGEPLLQPEFLNSLLEECKKRNIHTCLDTSGYASFDDFHKIGDKVDLYLYDIKMMDDEKHKEFTGVSNRLILENLKKLSERSNKIVVRIPLVSEVNDAVKNITQTAEFIRSLQGIRDISILPYHKIGNQKYRRLNKPFLMEKTESLSGKKIEKIKKKFEHFGFNVKIGE